MALLVLHPWAEAHASGVMQVVLCLGWTDGGCWWCSGWWHHHTVSMQCTAGVGHEPGIVIYHNVPHAW